MSFMGCIRDNKICILSIFIMSSTIVSATDVCKYEIANNSEINEIVVTKKCKEISIHFDDGKFYLEKPIIIKTNSASGISIYGNGLGNTSLFVLNKEGAFFIKTKKRDMVTQIENLTIYSMHASAKYAIKIDQPPGGNQHQRNVILKDIKISNYKNRHNFYFKNAIVLIGTWRPLVDNVFISGAFGPKRNKMYPKMSTCFSMYDVYSPTLIDSRCWRAQKGLNLISQKNPGAEGIMIDRCKFVQNIIGIEIYSKGREPEGFITDSHINALKVGIKITNRKYLYIVGNLFYRNKYSDDEYTDIKFRNIDYSIISNNIFHYPRKNGKGKRVHIELLDSHNNIIKNNLSTNGNILIESVIDPLLHQKNRFIKKEVKR